MVALQLLDLVCPTWLLWRCSKKANFRESAEVQWGITPSIKVCGQTLAGLPMLSVWIAKDGPGGGANRCYAPPLSPIIPHPAAGQPAHTC